MLNAFGVITCVAHLLDQTKPSDEELDQIRQAIEDYQKQRAK
jgi:hypothetical protein